MNDEVAKRLKESVTDFYEREGVIFARTRGFTWPEEQLIAQRIRPGMTVADIGAGNGRFARLLPLAKINYVGIEPSDALRGSADPALAIQPGGFPQIPLSDNFADVTVCFAVLHHIPTRAGRQAAVNELIRITKPGGLLAATAWYVDPTDPRSKIVEDGEAGDVWVDWKAGGAMSQRFVHCMTDQEWRNLWSHPQLEIERIGLFGRMDWTDDPKQARNWFVIAKRLQ